VPGGTSDTAQAIAMYDGSTIHDVIVARRQRDAAAD
jgi:hypothetical protein